MKHPANRGERRSVREVIGTRRSHYFSNRHKSKHHDTPTPCSCDMCGNPRRHFNERTVAELRSDMQFNYELKEVV
jgi:hypothetical protein